MPVGAHLAREAHRVRCQGSASGRLVDPDQVAHAGVTAQHLLRRTDHHRRGVDVDVEGVPGRTVTGRSETPPLAHGDELDGVHLPHRRTGPVDQTTRAQLDARAEERFATSSGSGDEAHVLALRLRRRAQAERTRPLPHLALGQRTDREDDATQDVPVEHVQHVALVLGRVRRPSQARSAVRAGDDPAVVARGDGVEAQCGGPVHQAVELEVAIALDAGVRGQTGSVVADVGLHDVTGEVVTEVEHQVLDVELLRDAPGIVDVADRATAGIALATPQLERHADDVVTVVAEQGGRHRRIDASGHGDQDLHDRPPGAYSEKRRSCSTAGGMTARAWSTSASVLDQPSDRRSAPAARSLAHTHGARARARPRPPRSSTTRPPRRRPPNARGGRARPRSRRHRCRRGRSPGPVPTDRASRRRAVLPSRRGRERRLRARRRACRAAWPAAPPSESRSAAVRRAATVAATMPATSGVPGRRPRSWPPPSWRGASATPDRATSTPVPFGPPNL